MTAPVPTTYAEARDGKRLVARPARVFSFHPASG